MIVTETQTGRLFEHIATRVDHDKKIYLFIITLVIRFQGTAADKQFVTYIHTYVCVCVRVCAC